MKKLLIVLLALTFVGIMAFADDAATVTFTGKVETGMQITFPNGGGDQTVIAHDDDSGKAPGRVDLDVKATLGGMELGYYIRSDSGAAFSPANYWAGYSFMDGMVILRAGATDAGTTGTVNKGWGDGINAKGGVQFIVAPIPGLSIGAAAGNISGTSALVKDTLAKPAIGFAYAAPGFGDIRVNYTAFDKLFTAGVNYTAMAGLTAQLEGYYQQDSSETILGVAIPLDSEFELFENVAYKMDALTVGLSAYEGKDTTDLLGTSSIAIKVIPNVSYAVNSMVSVGAEVGYTMAKAGEFIATKDISAPNDGTAAKDSGCYAKPSITFNFNKLASCLTAWYNTGDFMNKGAGTFEVNFRSFF